MYTNQSINQSIIFNFRKGRNCIFFRPMLLFGLKLVDFWKIYFLTSANQIFCLHHITRSELETLDPAPLISISTGDTFDVLLNPLLDILAGFQFPTNKSSLVD